jgi:hypothetical protein
MSLARAFTTKRSKRPEISAPTPQRSYSTRHAAPAGNFRNKISAPVELLSTTNMLSYNAPDLYPSSSSSISGDDADGIRSHLLSPPTSPDSSSIESQPYSPEANHLTNYFNPATRSSTSSNDDAPSIPQRAASHTKKTHERMSHKRSMSRLASNARSSAAMFGGFGPVAESQDRHPFGNELAQVSELAEEFAAQIHVVDEEEQELVSRGLLKFGAEDYMSEIQGLFMSAYGESKPMATMWI